MNTDSPYVEQAPSPWLMVRLLVAVAAALCALLASAFFYGPDYNLAFLMVGASALLAMVLVSGPAAASELFAEQPLAVAVAAYVLLALALQHVLASISFETSATGAWLLAIGPLAFLALGSASMLARRVGLAPDTPLLVLWGVLWLVVLISLARLLISNERPADPFSDASALSTLLYLGWVPWIHRLLGRAAAGWRWLLALVASTGLLTVLFATGSRAAIVLIVVAYAFWAALAARGRLPWRRWLTLLGAALFAYGLAYVTSVALKASVSEAVVEGEATNQRIELAEAALQAYEEGSVHGSGPLTFVLRYAQLRPRSDQSSGGAFVHNDYLQLLMEGGPWLLAPLLLLALAAGIALIRGLFFSAASTAAATAFDRLGGWLAIALACTHALLNFVVYTPALSLAMGAVLAWTLAPAARAVGPPAKLPAAALAGWCVAACLGLGALSVLVIDSMTVAVFSGQPAVFGSDRYRATPQRQQAFARGVTRLLPARGLPQLALAMAAEQRARAAAERQSATELVRALNDALHHFRRARQADPWNTEMLVHYARFLATRDRLGKQVGLPLPPIPSGLKSLRTDETPYTLLSDALDRNPRALGVLGPMVGLLEQQGREDEAYQRILDHFADWLENHLLAQPQLASRWLTELERRAAARGDIATLKQIEIARHRLAQEAPRVPRVWFKRWQQARAAGAG